GLNLAPPTAPAHEIIYYEIQKHLSRDNIARRAGIEGRVTVEVSIAPDGQILQAKVTEGTRAHPILKDMALDAVKKAPWRPLIKQGKAVPTQFRIRFDFGKEDTHLKLLRIQEIK
ncbi:MAG: energy transducer TonB, partial [Calditrichaeota bacterium]